MAAWSGRGDSDFGHDVHEDSDRPSTSDVNMLPTPGRKRKSTPDFQNDEDRESRCGHSMEEDERVPITDGKKLEEVMPDVLDKMTVDVPLLTKLVAKNALTTHQKEEIKGMQTNTEKVDKLMDYIRRDTHNKMEALLCALKETKQHLTVELLTMPKPASYESSSKEKRKLKIDTNEDTSPNPHKQVTKALTQEEVELIKAVGGSHEKIIEMDKRKQQTIAERVQNWTFEKKIYNLPEGEDINIALFGTSSTGKSTLGNLLLGKNAFKEGSHRHPLDNIHEEGESDYNGSTIRIFELPGTLLKETNMFNATAQNRIIQNALKNMPDTGVHAFLFVYDAAHCPGMQDEMAAFKKYMVLSDRMRKRCLMVVTHAHMLGPSIDVKTHLDENLYDPKRPGGGDLYLFVTKKLLKRVILVDSKTSPFEREHHRRAIFNAIAKMCTVDADGERFYPKSQLEKDIQISYNPFTLVREACHIQ